MKTLVCIVGLLLSHMSFSNSNPCLKNEIETSIHPDLSQFEFDMHHENFVVVQFEIRNFQIEILEIQGSSEELIEMITEELSQVTIDDTYTDGDSYSYKFIFKKL